MTRTMRASLAAAALGAALLASPSPAAAQGAATAGSDSLRVCVLVGDSLREVAATADAATGDTLVAGGQRLLEAYPPDRGYAEGATWYIANAPLVAGGRRHEKIGMPRVIAPGLLVPGGRHEGVPLFTDARAAGTVPEVYYVPVRRGCLFQPYVVPVYNVRGRR
ncbi:MAG TPA: hypothetical protein VGV85_02320 [Longimicrobiaceae bacterium]|nr:hypothetical protein [Longimicrobiaceae bacterium]